MMWQKERPANEKAQPPDWLLGCFLIAVTIMAYHPAWHGGFIWDDRVYITDDPMLTAPDALRRIWLTLESPSQYFPLTYTTFYIERALWGLNPAGYHLVNILLHAANALLLWRVLARLRVPGAWLAAAIFALHPVQVESVAWISERKNVLMGFFFLLTLWAWIKFIDNQCKRPWRYYALALVFYAPALLAKTTACTLPAALLLILWLEKKPVNWRRLAQIAPFVAMGIGMGLVTVSWERNHQGVQPQLFDIGLVERVLIASRALWFYAGKLFWPVNLTFSYPRWTISASDPRAYGWVLATAALVVAIWRARRRAGRSLEVAAVFFAVTLSPILGFVMLYTFRYTFVADHYQYLACIGPIALVSAVMIRKPVLAAVVVLALGALTWRQCGMYASTETLWQTTVRRNPNSWLAHSNLGLIFNQQGRTAEAISQYQMALEMKSDDECHYNLGSIYLHQGRLDDAIAQFQSAMAINPLYDKAFANLGMALAQQGRLDEAVVQYRQALAIAPDNAYAHNALGSALEVGNKLTEAAAQYSAAIASKPDFAEARENLGAILIRLHELPAAASQYSEVVRLRPDDLEANFNLALILSQLGQTGDAVSYFRKALDLATAAGRKDLVKQIQDRLPHEPVHQ